MCGLLSGLNKEWTSSTACLCGFPVRKKKKMKRIQPSPHFGLRRLSSPISYSGRMPGQPPPDAVCIISCVSAVGLECVTRAGSFIFKECPRPTLQEAAGVSRSIPPPAVTCRWPYINSWVAAQLAYSLCRCGAQVATY